MKQPPVPYEEDEQAWYFVWVYSNENRYPELKLINGSMNGVRVPPGVIRKLKMQGLRKGIPDIDIPIRTKDYVGLKIELKRIKGGSVSKEQKEIHRLFREQGWLVEVCRGHKEAIKVTKNYLGI